jgi:hypothetical protein
MTLSMGGARATLVPFQKGVVFNQIWAKNSEGEGKIRHCVRKCTPTGTRPVGRRLPDPGIPNKTEASQSEFVKKVLMTNAFSARNGFLGPCIFVALLFRVRLIVGRGVEEREENWIGRQRIQSAEERAAPLWRKPVNQLMELPFFGADIRRHN